MTRVNLITDYCKNYKIIQDKIHGMMNMSKLAITIIDTPIFQRLRNLKQLGVCYLVFPNAVHTRFEHSLGTYYLAKKLLNNLIINSSNYEIIEPLKNIEELKKYFIEKGVVELDDYIKELISISALCHDLGHGPFSHIFDDKFIPTIINDFNIGENKHHEYRSCVLLKKIIKDSFLKDIITDDEITFMTNLIHPDRSKHQGYIYQIVSNTLNGLDVDKYDYLTRDSTLLGINIAFSPDKLINNAIVINNIIAFPKQIDSDIINLFSTRHYLHRKIYSHKVVISIDLIICKLLTLINDVFKIGKCLENIDEKFINLTDNDILIRSKYLINYEVNELIKKITIHDFYPILYSTTLNSDDNVEDFIKNLITDKNLDKNKILISYHNIGYTNSRNPLDNIYVYTNKNCKLVKLIKFNITKLLPEIYQEKLLMIFYNGSKTDPEFNTIKEVF